MASGGKNREKPQAASKGPRIDIAGEAYCADLLWRTLADSLDHKGQAAPDVFHSRVERDDIIIGDGSEMATPTERFIIYAIKQWLVGPEFLEKGWPIPNKLRSTGDFDDFIVDAVHCDADLKPRPRKMALRHLIAPTSERKDLDASRNLLKKPAVMALIKGAVCDQINFGRGPKAPPLSVADIFDNKDIKGPEAIANLRRLLISDLPQQVAHSGPVVDLRLDRRDWLVQAEKVSKRQFHFFIANQEDPRNAMLEELCDELFRPETAHRIVNCHAQGMRRGLTALASELFAVRHRRSRNSDVPILYLALHGRSTEIPRDNFDELVFEIWTFFSEIERRRNDSGTVTTPPNYEPDRPHDLDDVVRMLGNIRRLMSKHPAVIILDGYRGAGSDINLPDNALHTLHSAISSDRVLDLIERLTFVPTPDADGPINVARFSQTKFLILSESRLYGDMLPGGGRRPNFPHPALKLSAGVLIEVPAPAGDTPAAFIPSLGYQAPEDINFIQTEIGGYKADDMAALEPLFHNHCRTLQEWSASYPFSESTYGVLSTLIMLGRKQPREPSTLTALIKEDLIPAVRYHAGGVWRVFLHLIAIAPGGVRPKTLARLYENYCEARLAPADRPRRKDINQSIAQMLKTMHAIVAVLRSDYSGRLHHRNLPLLYNNAPSYGPYEIECDRAIQFQFDELRKAFLADAAGCSANADGQYISLLHFLLAEEALEQFTHLARFESGALRESVYEYERLLAAIFHGAASLHDEKLTNELNYPVAGRLLPTNPSERWMVIYSHLYRRFLDRAPAHDMVRRFDAAQLKVDILLALARPQLCRGETGVNDAGWILPDPSKGVSKWHPNVEDKPQTALAFELRHAATAAARTININWGLSGMHSDDEATKRLEIAEKILLLAEGPGFDDDANALSDRIKDQISDIFGNNRADDYVRFVAKRARMIFDGRQRSKLLARDVEAKLATGAGVPPAKLRTLVEYLELYAEVLGLEADIEYGRQLTDATEQLPSEKVTAKFIQSFAAYYVADVLRRRLFSLFPNRSSDIPRGRAGRGFVRVSIKLERFAGLGNVEYRGRGFFWKHANYVLDELTRHLGQYPRERAALLMLNATVTRYTVTRAHGEYGTFLKKACECLCLAELLVLKLGMHSRLRQRFALERCKLMIECAQNFSDAQRQQYIGIAETDIQTLEALIPKGDPLWKSHILSQRENLETLKG